MNWEKVIAKHVDEYNEQYRTLVDWCDELYEKRQSSLELVSSVESLVNSIAHAPKSLATDISKLSTGKQEFKRSENIARMQFKNNLKAGAGTIAAGAAGAGIAAFAPTAAMGIATTFGVASTGTAISTLGGAAATNAALAWLGGGALAAGGGGVAGGTALLALAGPIGWATGGLILVTSGIIFAKKKKEITEEAEFQIREIDNARARLHACEGQVRKLCENTGNRLNELRNQLDRLQNLTGKDFTEIKPSERFGLATVINNATALSKLLNETVE